MMHFGKKLFFQVFILCAVLGSITSQHCVAQATPDTSLNNIIRDDTGRQKAAVPHAQIGEQEVIPADTDTTALLSAKPKPFQPNPKKAGLYSALVPGLGQLYNRQYWKIPVVYAGLGVAGYFIIKDLDTFQAYRKAYIGRINNPYPTDKYVGIYNTQQLQQLQNDFNKYLDLAVLFTTIGYALEVLDAVTAAHLKNFDMSRDISMRIKPVAAPNGIGLGLVMNFK